MLASRALFALLGASMTKATLGGFAGCLAKAGIDLCRGTLEDEPLAVELLQVQASRSPQQYNGPTSQLSVVVDSGVEVSSPTLASATTAAAPSKTSQNASQPDAPYSAAMPAMVEQHANASRAAAASAAAPSSLAAAAGNSSRAESTDGRLWPFSNIVDAVRDAISNIGSGDVEAKIAPFISAIKPTLLSLEEKADVFLSYTALYKDALLLNTSQSGDSQNIQAMVVAHIAPVSQLFGQVVDALTTAGPIFCQSVKALGLPADEVHIAMSRILEITTNHIKNAMGSTTTIIGNLGEPSKELDHALSELKSTVNYGLDAAVSLEHEFTQLVQGIMEGAAEKFGFTLIHAKEGLQEPFQEVGATLTAFVQQATQTVSKVSSGVAKYLSGTYEAAGMVGAFLAINSTLLSLDEKAAVFLSYTALYKDDLLLNISQSRDRKIQNIQAMVVASITPVNQLFGQLVDALTAAGPILSQSVAALGLPADEVQIAMSRTLETTTLIKNAMGNTTTTIGNLGEPSKELGHALSELNSTVNYGLNAAVSLEHEFTQLVQGVTAGVAKKFGATLVQAREVQQATQTVSKASSGVANYLSGTYEAAKMVPSPPGEDGAASGHHLLAGLAVAAVCVGAGPP